jgi:hypothetical protein
VTDYLLRHACLAWAQADVGDDSVGGDFECDGCAAYAVAAVAAVAAVDDGVEVD